MVDIKAFRDAKKITQKELSDAIGVPQTFISAIELGRRPFPEKHVAALRAKFGDEIDAFIIAKDANMNVGEIRREYERRLAEKDKQISDLIETNKLLVVALKNANPDVRRVGFAEAAGA